MNKESLIKAAEQGGASAQFELGCFYYGEQDYQTAAEWYTKAAEQDHVNAQYTLGMLYLLVLRDPAKAVKWLTRASFLGDEEATAELARLAAL